jgi:hypothetical protein
MKSYVKVCLFGVAIVIAMIISLLTPIHAIADDITPPPVQTEASPPPLETEAPLPMEGEAGGSEAINIQEGEADNEQGGDGDETINSQENEPGNDQETPQDEGEMSEETPQDISEIIGQLSEGTEIHLETHEGIEPLVTLQAESLILVGDPIWCPQGVTDPSPNAHGCSNSYTDLADLVNNFPDPGAPGVIWITEGIDLSSSFISLDGGNYANWYKEDLVIQGGWNGANVGGVISSATTINVPIEIIGWEGNITINDIIIMGAAGTGLYVEVDNGVSLKDLEITGNEESGLYINTGGIVTAENITVNNNGWASSSGYGAEISGSEFHLSGTNEFNGNYESGLYVSTIDNIEIENLTASNNGLSGYATGAELYSASGDVYLLGDNQFTDNLNNGLYIEALNGSIIAENITASSNGIGASYAPGAELIAAGLNLTGNNVFVWNNNTGLYAEISGDITITNLNASNNGSPGTYGPGAGLYSTGKVTITGTNVFSGNSSEGLIIDAGGNISVTNVDALNNGSSGLAFITNADAYVECGSVLNNGDVQIDTSMASGTLTLAGVNFGGNPGQNVGIDESQLTLVSNRCFNYAQREGYGSRGWSATPHKVKYVTAVEGQNVNLDCAFHEATYILLKDGDGAIIPCPIVGTAKLGSVEEITPYKILPDTNKFISGINLTISGSGESQMFKPVDVPQIVWYFNETSDETGGYEAVSWDGDEWVDTPLFLTIFFLVPEELDTQNLAILYWDGANWAELSNDTHMGQGRIVSGLEYSENSGYLQANVNFTGVFVLAQK